VSIRESTILVLSDSTIIRTSVADALRATGRYQVIAGEAGENVAQTSPPAAAIVDLSCSLLYGLGRATAPETRILVYGRRDKETLSSAIDLGADRFVSINATAEEIVIAVTEVLLNRDHTERTSTHLSEFCGCEHRTDVARGGHRLTRRERDVARLLAADYRNKEIAAELHLELSTVKTHVHSILRKLDLQSREDVRASAAQRQS
jgi:DNA-binding NarL/FixJ family response regulator